MINDEELGQWISEFHPTVETEIIEVLRARVQYAICLLYTSPSPRDVEESRMPSSA